MNPGTGAIRRGAPDVTGYRPTKGLLGRIWREFARPSRRRLAVFFVVLLAVSGLGVLPPVIFGRIIDHGVMAGNLKVVLWLGAAAGVVAVLSAVLGVAQRYLSASISERLIYDLRQRLYDHIQRMPLAFFTRTRCGALISRINNDVIGAQQAVTGQFGNVAADAVQLAVALGVMVSIEWRLTLALLILLVAFAGVARRVARRLQALTREQMRHNAAMSDRMTERFNVSGALLVKLFGRPDEEAREFNDTAWRVADVSLRRAVISRTFFATLTMVGALGVALVYGVGGAMAVTGGAVTAGQIVTLAGLVMTAYQPLNRLSNAHVELLTALVSFERVFEVLDLPTGQAPHEGAVALQRPRGDLALERVRFAYPPASEVTLASLRRGDEQGGEPLPDLEHHVATPVLHDVTLSVPEGWTVALVGPSGSGKSTILSLVARLYDVDAGAVRLDGVDVRDLTPASLSAALAMVSQDPHLFHDTIAANLRYAAPQASDADLEAVCRAAHIHDLIAGLPQGYQTIVGERGYRLSGGEKQRLAIARVLLADPAVVLLDEATSHLDSESEAAVQAALGEALRGRTSLVIAHRLSTIMRADRIVVVADGRVVQQGTHDELVSAPGLYATLFRTQFGPGHAGLTTPAGRHPGSAAETANDPIP
jgi:ATP-binding cassette subfamily B protein